VLTTPLSRSLLEVWTIREKGGESVEQSTPGTGEALGDEHGEEGSGAPRYGRRLLMLGAGAAGAGLAAALAASADPAGAANNSPVELGESNAASGSTQITTSAGNGLNGLTTSPESYSCGVYGQAQAGIGVLGTPASRSGLLGAGGNPTIAGVVGDSGAGVTGVLGLATSSTGVEGISTSGTGVEGISTNGTGVEGLSTNGTGVQGTITGETNGQSGVAGIDNSSLGTGGHGVYGRSAQGTGVYGTQTSTSGLLRTFGVPINGGVIGDTGDGTGVVGLGSSNGVFGQSTEGTGIVGVSASDVGVSGYSSTGTGVYGWTGGASSMGQAGVSGTDGSTGGGYGVYGFSVNGDGVYGSIVGSNTGKRAVYGDDTTTDGGYGVSGYSVKGVGVSAGSSDGTALAVDGAATFTGPTTFSRSGLATVAGTSSKSAQRVTVTGVALSDTSLVLATAQGIVAGVAIEGVVTDVAASSFVISLTKAIKVSLDIAWFVVG